LRAPEYIRDGRLTPLDTLFDPDDRADFYEPLLRMFQRDGVTYACPRDFQTVALLVNQDMFDEAGVLVPGTWGELWDAAQVLTDLDAGVRGLGLTPNLWNWLPFLFQAGGALFDESGTELTLETPEAEDALNFYTDLHLAEFARMPPEDQSWPLIEGRNWLIQAFAGQEVAMILGANDSYVALQGLEAGFNLRVAELPAGPGGRGTIPYVAGFGLFDGFAPVQPASALLQFTCSREGTRIWAESAIYMPARRSLRQEWVEMHPDAVAFINGVEHAFSYQPARASFEAIAEFDEQATGILDDAMRGEILVVEALRQLQNAGAELLQE
jgi:multiple sugar transport system substrate-binding protein